jgi:hypothetical protein
VPKNPAFPVSPTIGSVRVQSSWPTTRTVKGNPLLPDAALVDTASHPQFPVGGRRPLLLQLPPRRLPRFGAIPRDTVLLRLRDVLTVVGIFPYLHLVQRVRSHPRWCPLRKQHRPKSLPPWTMSPMVLMSLVST